MSLEQGGTAQPSAFGKAEGILGAAGSTHPATPCRNATEEALRSRCQRQVVAEGARLLTDPLPSLPPAPCCGQIFFKPPILPLFHHAQAGRQRAPKLEDPSWVLGACQHRGGRRRRGRAPARARTRPRRSTRSCQQHVGVHDTFGHARERTDSLTTGQKKSPPPSRPDLLLLLPALPSPCPPSRPGRRTPTVIEEEQHGKSQRGGGQEDEADVAGDHEVAHHQGDLVLVQPVPLQGPRCHGVLASRHAGPSRRGPKLNPPATHPRQSSHQAHADALRARFFASCKPQASPEVPILQEQEGEEARRRLQQQAAGPTLAIPAPSALPREPCAPLLSNPPPSSRGGVDPRVPTGSSRLSSAELKCQELNLRCRDGDGVARGSWGGTPRHPRAPLPVSGAGKGAVGGGPARDPPLRLRVLPTGGSASGLALGTPPPLLRARSGRLLQPQLLGVGAPAIPDPAGRVLGGPQQAAAPLTATANPSPLGSAFSRSSRRSALPRRLASSPAPSQPSGEQEGATASLVPLRGLSPRWQGARCLLSPPRWPGRASSPAHAAVTCQSVAERPPSLTEPGIKRAPSAAGGSSGRLCPVCAVTARGPDPRSQTMKEPGELKKKKTPKKSQVCVPACPTP